jgi:hypothetical protein
MTRIVLDLDALSTEELEEAADALERERAAFEGVDVALHPELVHFFDELTEAVAGEAAVRHAAESRHEIAEALAVDESTGEWLAGA